MSSVTVACHKHDTYSSTIRYEKHTRNNVSDTNNSAACFIILLLRKTGNTMKSAKRHLTAGDQLPGAVRATRRWWWIRPPTPHKDASVGRRHAKDDRHARVSITARDAVVIVVLRQKKKTGSGGNNVLVLGVSPVSRRLPSHCNPAHQRRYSTKQQPTPPRWWGSAPAARTSLAAAVGGWKPPCGGPPFRANAAWARDNDRGCVRWGERSCPRTRRPLPRVTQIPRSTRLVYVYV